MPKIRKPKLVPDWRRSWRWISMQMMTAAVAVQGSWLAVPDDLKSTVPHGLVQWVTLALLLLGVGGRLVTQSPPAAPGGEQ
jgi:hypothetical protein